MKGYIKNISVLPALGVPVPAFPTKIVIDPDGRMRNYIVGEDEELYNNLIHII